jgi:hypothetical protein
LQRGITSDLGNIEHQTLNMEGATAANIQHPTPNIQHPTSNIQHPTDGDWSEGDSNDY